MARPRAEVTASAAEPTSVLIPRLAATEAISAAPSPDAKKAAVTAVTGMPMASARFVLASESF